MMLGIFHLDPAGSRSIHAPPLTLTAPWSAAIHMSSFLRRPLRVLGPRTSGDGRGKRSAAALWNDLD
jgi:hypothetical protein